MATDMLLELLTHMNPALIFDLEKYHPKAFKKYNDHKNSFLFIIKENIEWGKKEGLYREEITGGYHGKVQAGFGFPGI
jgi:hypothetical protein